MKHKIIFEGNLDELLKFLSPIKVDYIIDGKYKDIIFILGVKK